MDMAVGGLKEKVEVGWNISCNLGKQTCADQQMLVRLFELNWLYPHLTSFSILTLLEQVYRLAIKAQDMEVFHVSG